MTVQMPIPSDVPAVEARIVPARVVALSADRSAIFFDTAVTWLPRAARLAALARGRPIEGPVVVTRLGRKGGGERHVLLLARPASEVCASSLSVEAAGVPVAGVDPMVLQSPLVDPLALVSGLDESGALRLLKLLLTTGASLFGKGDLGGFGMLVGQLIDSLAPPIPLAAWCAVGRRAAVLSWRLPGDLGLPELRDLCILHDGRARRFTDFTAIEEPMSGGRLVHLLLTRPLPEGADLIILGEKPVRLGGIRGTAARALAGWLERREPAARARALDWLDAVAAGDARVAALRDEILCPDEAEPRIGNMCLLETPTGLIYLLSVDDPHGLLAAVRLTIARQEIDLRCEQLQWHARHGAVLAGFAPLAGRSGGAASIAPIYRSGRVGTASAAATAPFDGRTPSDFDGLPREIAAAVLARAMPAAMRGRPVRRRRIAEFGTMPAAPRLALVLAAGEAPEHLHAAIAALVAQPGGRRIEVVLHHEDGATTEMVRRTAESLAAVHRLGLRVVSVAPGAFASEGLRAALAETRAPAVLALGPGCLPGAPGWLAAWRRRIARGGGARVVAITPVSSHGAPAESGHALGLNAAAIACLLAARPVLPGVASDIAATRCLRVSAAKGLSVTSYGCADGDPLVRAAERLIVASSRETRHA